MGNTFSERFSWLRTLSFDAPLKISSLGLLAGVFLLCGMSATAWAQKTPMAPAKPKVQTSPADETRTPAPVRSVHSMGKDWMVPMCPSHFHDSLRTNGIAGPHDKDVTPPVATKTVPGAITLAAIAASNKTHIGNYVVIVNVVVNTEGIPTHLCLQKSSGYGLDAATAGAVPQDRFKPAMKDGKPVPMRVPVIMRYENPVVGMGPQAPSGQPAE